MKKVRVKTAKVRVSVAFFDGGMTLGKLLEKNKDLDKLLELIARSMVDFRIKTIELENDPRGKK